MKPILADLNKTPLLKSLKVSDLETKCSFHLMEDAGETCPIHKPGEFPKTKTNTILY
jgi:hypothetical protein